MEEPWKTYKQTAIQITDAGDTQFQFDQVWPEWFFNQVNTDTIRKGGRPAAGIVFYTPEAEGTIGNPGDPLIAADLELIRADAVGELAAINQYEAHIMALNSAPDKTVLEHIEAQEKEHLAELNTLIASMDPTQAAKFEESGITGDSGLEARVKELEADVERLSGPHVELVAETLTPGGEMEGPHAEIVAAEGPPPGQSVAEWISRLGGSPGILVDPGVARATPCIEYNLGPGRRPLVYSKGIIGALDDEQKELYCQEGVHALPLTPKQQARLEAMEQGSRRCSELTQGQPPEVRIPNYFGCLGQELRKKGTEPW